MERTDPPSLAERYGYHFTDASLLQLALRHASFASEHELDSNERLEFLGDAILGFVVVEHLWKSYPQLDEGHLAKVKAVVVSSTVLAERALAIGLDGDLELGRSFHDLKVASMPSVLEDGFEALIGAIYLDGGLEAAKSFVLGQLDPVITREIAAPGGLDFKSQLHEWSTKHHGEGPRYELVDLGGAGNDSWFGATVFVDGRIAGRGEGRSKKAAEQVAAQEAWEGVASA